MPSQVYEKPDYWSRKAFAEGYPARSVYKLEEIVSKFNLLKRKGKTLDLGAAPGSWTAYLLKKSEGNVVACDLNPLDKTVKSDNLTFIQGDLNDAAVREQICAYGPYDLVVCDAAPPTSGNRTVDTARSEQLVDMAIWYAASALHQGGNFTVKIFQGGGQREALKKMNELFESTKFFKPKACRTASFETYLVGIFRK